MEKGLTAVSLASSSHGPLAAALVSVYLPTRNRSALVERAIDSVIAQSYEHIELIVVDDCSEDDTAEVVRRCMARNHTAKRIEHVRLDAPSGPAVARNEAIVRATGHLVTGLDDDDYFLPERIARLVAAFDPAVSSFVFGGYLRETTMLGGRLRRTAVPLSRPASLRDLLKRNIVGNQVLTLTSRLRDIGGFDPRLPAWEDYDLWIRLVKAFGDARPAGGLTYVHTVDGTRPRLSHDTVKASRAYDIFLEKHAEYADAELRLCLRLAKTCFGIDALALSDIPTLIRLGEPRYVLFALYSYMAARWSRSSSQ